MSNPKNDETEILIESFLRKLTGKQRKLLTEACQRPIIGSSGATISNVKGLSISEIKLEDKNAMGGLIGTLRREKVGTLGTILSEIRRDDEGKKVYGINEKIINKTTLLDLLKKVDEY